MGYLTPLLICAFLASATAVPTGLRHTCAQTCSDGNKFAYERGMSYEYDYAVQTTTTNSPMDFEEQAVLVVTAKATIGVLAPCEYVLSLSDVSLDGSTRNSEFSSELTKMPLRFAFDDGRISEVCNGAQDEVWVTNFKRGVLTAFQNSMEKLEEGQRISELDVTGECETDYQVKMQAADDTITIERTKSSDACKRLPVSTLTTIPTSIARLPLLSSEQKCTQKIMAGVMQEAKCDETLFLKPVTGSQGGATTAVTTMLKLVNTKVGVHLADFEMIKSTMAFDSSSTPTNTEGYVRIIESLLSELDRLSMPVLQAGVPALFSQLVENLRHLDERQLGLLYEANKGTRVWRFLVDAAPMVATSASTGLVSELIHTRQMTNEEAEVWYTSLAFVPNPDADMFSNLPVLLRDHPSKKALLGISAMVNTFCKIDTSCLEQDNVRQIILAIEANLGSACRSTSLEEKEIILTTLKALGNAGHWTNTEVMEKCYTEELNPAEVRVAALEAWRRAPCGFDRSGLMNIFLNSQQDSEIRIASYLSLMACPSQDLVNNIKDRLLSESVNQVGSFVWTHLSNLQETASHEKQWIRELIGEEILVNKFNISSLKFSRNFESSFYMEELGLGTTMDSNIIFSSRSFLPRSGMFNLTFDLFGESINMLEVGGRFEGFEVFAEKFFGPNGYYPEETVEAILKNLRQSSSSQETTIEQMLDIVTDQPEGSYYVRVLGNDVQYHHFRGIENFFETRPDVNFVELFMEFAKNGNVDYSKSYKLIDTELTYPTVSGLPLSLKLNSTATVGLRMNGDFSLRSFSDIDIQGHIYPSAAVQVDATMLVDAHVSKSGIKITSNIHTSAFLEGNLKIEGGRVIDIALDMPEDRVELIGVKYEKVFIEHSTELRSEQDEEDVIINCSGTTSLIGVEICTLHRFSVHESDIRVFIEKTDLNSGYVLRFLKETNGISFLLDTPRSRIDRQFSLVAIQDERDVRMDIHTPWKSLKARGVWVTGDDGKRFELEVFTDSVNSYQVSAGYSVSRDANTYKFQPAVTIRSPERLILDAVGSFETNSQLQTIDINLQNGGMMPASFQFSGSYAENMHRVESRLTSAILTASASGSLSTTEGLLSQLDVNYSIMGQSNQYIKHYVKLQNAVSEQETAFSGAFVLQMSQFPNFDVNTKGRLSYTPGRVETSASLHYGVDILDLSVDSTINYAFDNELKSYDARVSVTSSSHDTNVLLTEKFRLRHNYLFRECYLRLTPFYEMTSKTELGYSRDDEGFARFQLTFPNFDLSQDLTYTKIAEKYYTVKVLGHVNTINWDLEGSYQDRSISGQSVDLLLSAKSRIDNVEGVADLIIKADQQGVLVNGKSTYQGIQKFAKIEATRTSIEVDADILTHMHLKAQIVPEGPIKTVEVTGTWDEDTLPGHLTLLGTLTSNTISGHFKYGIIEKSFRGEIQPNGAIIEVQLDPSKLITGRVTYNMGNEMLISASVETPFRGYEKQEAMFSFKKVDNTEFASQISITWRNSQLLAMSVSGKVESNSLSSHMNTGVTLMCNESIFGFERFVFILNHERNAQDIDSNLSGIVDGTEVFSGVIKSVVSPQRTILDAQLITPVTEDFTFKIDHILFTKGNVEIRYGARYAISTWEKQYLPNSSGVQYEYSHTSTEMTDFHIQATYRRSENREVFEMEGTYGETKSLATFILENNQILNGRQYVGNMRIVLPQRAPITGSLTTSFLNDKQLITDLEITRFWSTYGSLKVHTNLNIESFSNVQFVASVASPDTRASLDSIFKLESVNLESYMKGSFNGMQYSITVNGIVDPENGKIMVHNTVMTKETVVLQVTLDYQKNEGIYITNLKLNGGPTNYDIAHTVTYTDIFNWTNKLSVNNIYFNNEMTFSNNIYTHNLDWNVNGGIIRGNTSFSADLNGVNEHLNANMRLSSSWMEDINITVKLEADGIVYIPEIIIEYGSDYTISLKSICTCTSEECSIKLDAISSFWEPITFEGVYKMSSPKALKISYAVGSDRTTVDITGIYNQHEKYGSINIISTYLPFPIIAEAGYVRTGNEVTISLTLNTNKVYKGKLIFATMYRNGKLSVEIELPCAQLARAIIMMDYDFRQQPYVASFTLNTNENVISINGRLSRNSLTIESNIDGMRGKMESVWNIEQSVGNVLTNFTSPSEDFSAVEIEVNYNIANIMLLFNANYNSINIIHLSSKIEDKTGHIEGRISVPYNLQYKSLLSYDESGFEVKLSQDDETIALEGHYNMESNAGELFLNLETPFQGVESGSAVVKYNFLNEKSIEFEASVADKKIGFTIAADIDDLKTSSFSLQAISFLDHYKTIGGSVKFDMLSETKTCEVEFYRNLEKVAWKIEVYNEEPGKGNVTITVITPFDEYENVEIGMHYSFMSGLYETDIYRILNSIRTEYFMKLLLNARSVSGEIISPTSSWQKVSFTGNFEADSNILNASLILHINNDTITFAGEVLTNSVTPKLSVTLTTPYDSFRSFELDVTCKLSEEEHVFEATMKTEQDTYNMNMSMKKQYKQGEFSFAVSTPLPQYSNLNLKAIYNFLHDVKSAKIEFEFNGQRELFAADLQINNNNIILNLETPFHDFRQIEFTGDITMVSGRRTVMAQLRNGSDTYILHGEISLSERYFNLRSNIPHSQYGLMEITGQQTSTGYLLRIVKNREESNIVLDYNFEANSASVRLRTPFTGYNNVMMDYQFQKIQNVISGSINFEKDNIKFQCNGRFRYADLKSSVILNAEIPSLNQKIAFKANYDLTTDTKEAEISAKYNSMEQKLKITIRYDVNSAALRIAVPFINEEYGAEYSFNVDTSNKTVNGSFVALIGSQTYEFTAYSKIESNGLELKLVTPFNGYENILISAHINLQLNVVKAKFLFGQYESQFDLTYSRTNLLLEISSPFTILGHFKLSSNIINSNLEKKLCISAIYNQYTYGFTAKYQPENREELLSLELNFNEDYYKISGNVIVEQQRAYVSWHLETPINGLTNLRFVAKLDTTVEERAIEITLQNENDNKMIAIIGKIVGDLIDVSIRSPYNGIENFRTYGSLNRSKRAVEFYVMNDGSEGSIRASFNSLEINLHSPYEAVRESSLQIRRTDAQGLEIHYKRGDNHIDFTATPTGRRRTFDVAISSAFPGWEYLALTGRLDRDDLFGYLSGQINEEKMTIEGGGTYSRSESNLTFVATTPYSEYRTVFISLVSNLRRRELNFELRSSSSEARIIIVSTRPQLTVDIYIPNSAQPTVVTGDFTALNGHLVINSRFAACRTFDFQYTVVLGRNQLNLDVGITHNDVELFKVEFRRGGSETHLQIDARRRGNHSMIYYHRTGLEIFEFIYNRNGREFKVEAQCTGNLPVEGSIDLVINNSFREIPVTVSGHIDVDRSGTPKHITLNLTYPNREQYVIDLRYNISLRNPKIGDYDLTITTPDPRGNAHLTGSWNFTDHNDATINFTAGRVGYTARGKFGLLETNIVISSSTSVSRDFHIEWRFYKTTPPTGEVRRDYYFKIGRSDRFVMSKLLGITRGLESGELDFEIQISRFMHNPLKITASRHHDHTGFSGEGTFEYGQYHGTHILKRLQREASTRSAIISWEAITNIPGFSKITIDGEYNFNHQAVVKLDIIWDTSTISINFNIQDITSNFTQQTASFTLPGIGDVDITFGHDFRNRRKRTFTAIAHLMGRESHIKAEWNRNRDFSKLSGTVDIQSIVVGHISIEGSYDLRNIRNARAELSYTRNDDKNFHFKWHRRVTAHELDAEIEFESHSVMLPSAKFSINATFNNNFHLNVLIQGRGQEIKLQFNVEPNSITGEFTSPIPGFESVTGSFVYDTSNTRNRTATLRYQRGSRIITMDLNLQLTSRNAGSVHVNLETPFEFVQTLSLDASWRNNVGEVHYKRNDISYSFTGAAEVRTDRTSFEITFTPTSAEPIKIAFNFNADSLISGTHSESQDIAKLELELLGRRVCFDLKGFRNSEHIMFEMEAESSFEILREFSIKLDSDLTLEDREGLFEIKVNDFYYKIKNKFERRPENGYYLRSEIDSSLTDLPGITIGFGREGDETILTVGTGEDREITFSFAAKDHFRRGFSGKISLPRRGLIDVAYDVNYSFSGDDILNADLTLQLEPSKLIEIDIVYNSDGVRGRLSSPETGRHSIRARRSISENAFYAEVGIDDYNISLRGDLLNSDNKRGFVISGEIFGRTISIETLFQSEGCKYMEGKFIIQTTIPNYENLGGLFTFSNDDGKILGRSEINLPSYITPKIYTNIDLDLNGKINGLVSVDISGQVFSLNIDIIGNIEEGYNGQIQITTPFHSASQIILTGHLKYISMRNIESSIKVEHFFGSYNVLLNYDISSDRIFTEAKLESNTSEMNLHVKFNHEITNNQIKTYLLINNFEGNLELLSTNELLNFKVNVFSVYLGKPVVIAFSGHVEPTKIISGEVTLSVLEQSHIITGKLETNNNEIEFSSLINSPLIGGRRLISLKHAIPINYCRDNFMVQLTYIDEDTHDILLNVDRNDGFKSILSLDSPTGMSSLELYLSIPSGGYNAGVILKLPQYDEHKVMISLQHDLNLNSNSLDIQGTVEFEIQVVSPLLPNNILYKFKGEISDEKRMSTQSLTFGNIHQSLRSGYSYTSNGVLLIIEVDTPLFDINRASLTADLSLTNIIRTVIVMAFKDQTHSFDMKINTDNQKITAVVRSPFISGEMAKAEVSAVGTSARNLRLEIYFRFENKTYAAKLNIDASSVNHMTVGLLVKSPFRGYRKMNFGASFEKDDIITATFFADRPFGYKLEVKFGESEDAQNVSLVVNTPIRGLETFSVLVDVPLTKIAPKIILQLPSSVYQIDFVVENEEFTKKMSGNLNLNGITYEAAIGLRNKAPYELSYHYKIHNIFKRFHIMMDSSIFSVVSLIL